MFGIQHKAARPMIRSRPRQCPEPAFRTLTLAEGESEGHEVGRKRIIVLHLNTHFFSAACRPSFRG